MVVQVRPPPPPPMSQSIPLGFFSGSALIIIFFWAWSEIFLWMPDSWISVSPALLVVTLAWFAAFRRYPAVPRLAQVLGFGLLSAVATFRVVTIHKTSDADMLGGGISGLLIFALVSMDQSQMKED